MVASFTERVSVLIDVTGDKAASSLQTFKGKVNDAEGAFGKLKAGASGAFDMIGALGPAAAAGAALAVGKAVESMVTGFEDLALKANDFAQATGLGVDEASRWMEVAGDVGVNVETLGGAINKMNLAAGKGTLKQLGVEGETTGDQLLASLQHLQSIPSASERATEGVAIFGKSWTQLAPLVESSKDLKQALKDVSSGQAINPAEVQKAKEFRDAMDNLSDSWTNFTMQVGEAAIGPITDVLETVGNIGEAIGKLGGAGGGVDWGEVFGMNTLSDITGGLKQASDGSLSLVDNMKGIGKATFGLIPGLGGWADSTFTVSNAQDTATAASDALALSAKKQAEQVAAATKEIDDNTRAVLGAINSQLGFEDAQGKTTKAIGEYVDAAVVASQEGGTNAAAVDKMKASMNDAEQAALAQASAALKLAQDTATASGASLTAGESNDVLRAALLDVASTLGPNDPLRAALFGYIDQLGKVPRDVTTDVNADTSQAEREIKGLMGTIQQLVLPKNVHIGATTSTSAAAAPTGGGPTVGATAGATAGGLPGAVTPHLQAAGGGGHTTIVYNAPPGMNAADVVRVLNRWATTRGAVATAGATGL